MVKSELFVAVRISDAAGEVDDDLGTKPTDRWCCGFGPIGEAERATGVPTVSPKKTMELPRTQLTLGLIGSSALF